MIGFFDSGSGGLTVLKACAQHLPNEALYYLGDHARAPYGHRDNKDILTFTAEAVAYLFDQGCDLVVLSCNTAAAVALRVLQQNWLPQYAPESRILGVLVPTVEAISGLPWHVENDDGRILGQDKFIGVFATPKTVSAESYVDEIVKRSPRTEVVQVACPSLVDAIEGHLDEGKIDALVKNYCEELLLSSNGRIPDAVLLGCTHYPLIKDVFKRHLPCETELVSQPDIVAHALLKYLKRHPRYQKSDREDKGVIFSTTGDLPHVAQTASTLAGMDAVFRHVDLTFYSSVSASLAPGRVPPSRAAK